MSNPSINVSIVADIAQLSGNLKKAEGMVATTVQTMGRDIDKASLGSRIMGGLTGERGITNAALALKSAAFIAKQEINTTSQLLNAAGTAALMAPNPYVKAAGALGVLGSIAAENWMWVDEAVVAEIEAEKERQRLMAENTKKLVEQTNHLKEIARIEAITEPIARRTAQYKLEMANLTEEQLRLEQEADATEVAAFTRARQELLTREYELDIAKMKADEQKRLADEAQREADAKKAALDAARKMPTPAGLVGSITTSQGGMFNFANPMAALYGRATDQYAIQQRMFSIIQQILFTLRRPGLIT